MQNSTCLIDEHYIRRCGRSLTNLAVLGQLAAALSLVLVPLVLYSIQAPTVAGMPPVTFARHAYLEGEFAAYNSLGVARQLLVLVLLETVRRFGRSLSGDAPLGHRTLRSLALLCWPCLALSLALAVNATPWTSCWPGEDGMLETSSSLSFDVGFAPLYFGALAVTGIVLLRRIIRHALVLRSESEGFV